MIFKKKIFFYLPFNKIIWTNNVASFMNSPFYQLRVSRIFDEKLFCSFCCCYASVSNHWDYQKYQMTTLYEYEEAIDNDILTCDHNALSYHSRRLIISPQHFSLSSYLSNFIFVCLKLFQLKNSLLLPQFELIQCLHFLLPLNIRVSADIKSASRISYLPGLIMLEMQ